MSSELVSSVEAKIGALRLSKDKDDMVIIKTDTEALSMELAKVHDEVSKAGAATQSTGSESSSGQDATQGDTGTQPEGDIKDAEVK